MKLSVCVITYNHERYLAAALDGALAQRTSFPFEIVVGEDCSTDGTRQVLLDYARRHPDVIRPLLPARNLGVNRNLAETLAACRGEYVALLEGDDFWTDPTKLERQVALLDGDRTLGATFHDVMIVHSNGEPIRRSPAPKRRSRRYTIDDLLDLGNFIPTCSAVLRSGVIGPLPAWFLELRIGDFPLHVLQAQHGDIGYLPRVMGAYRLHPGGVFSNGQPTQNVATMSEMLEALGAHLPASSGTKLRSMSNYLRAVEHFRVGRVEEGRRAARRSIDGYRIDRRAVAAAMMAWTPRLYLWIKHARSHFAA